MTTTDLLDADDLSIGELATLTGLSVHTLRYYEKIGLIKPVPRQDSGHRRYGRQTVVRAEALSYLRATGLGIEDMRLYLDSVDQGDSAAGDLTTLLDAHATRIADQIKALRIRQAYIAAKADYWRAVADGRGHTRAAQRSLQRARDLSGELR